MNEKCEIKILGIIQVHTQRMDAKTEKNILIEGIKLYWKTGLTDLHKVEVRFRS